jgi:hypothetical protein
LKKGTSIAFCVLILCSLLFVGIANAGNAAYSITEIYGASTATIDGKWTSPSEWTDAPHTFMTGNATGKFAYKVDANFAPMWIVEMLGDSTNNAGDYVQICFDDSNSGGSAPSSGDFMLEVDGHTTLKIFSGSGTGWTQIANTAEITWANTIGVSMWSSTPHWILEIMDSSKTDGSVQIPNSPPTGMRVAAFDAATNGFAAWAPGSTANNPDSWGLVADFASEIPEGFSFGAVLLIASVAVLVGFFYLRRKPNIANVKSVRV